MALFAFVGYDIVHVWMSKIPTVTSQILSFCAFFNNYSENGLFLGVFSLVIN